MFYKPTYMQRQSNYPTNEQVSASRIIARATARIPGRQGVTIITAFQLSYYYAFWFVFSAKSARSPRRTWRLIRVEKPRVTFPATRTLTLEEMIESVVGKTEGVKITKSYPAGKRNFAASLERIANPDARAKQIPGIAPQTAYVNRKSALGRAGRFVAVGGRV